MSIAERIRQGVYGPGVFRCISGRASVVVVFTVLLILIVCVPPVWRQAAEKAHKRSVPVAMLRVFAAALEDFKLAVGRYPGTDEGLHLLTRPVADRYIPFMTRIPRDPWGQEYQYACPGVHNVDSYDLYSFGPDGKAGTGDDTTNWGEITVRP